ncbi:hypothetical protein GLX30_31630 [Streptomyces sp. Tu 2975]|uniref:hypothetical protein n=1 Tax=Streptomyces sp. Tu 2975 TaxID=2676871 RepID=UPI00135B0BBF|nr:hypothetical protein [Streptomyces sp. Tu 2975]QIP87831.1 hypothetical protein GLX30_31630 [Streptomyces sp. Tu 2975]
MHDDYFGIWGYSPVWQPGRDAAAAHGERLARLAGRTLTHAWLLWDVDDDEWFADAPVLLDFDGEQLEIQHGKLDDLSLTWNTVVPDTNPFLWASSMLRWRNDLVAASDEAVSAVELLEWRGQDMAHGMVAVSIVLAHGRVTVHNALDENGLAFGPPEPEYHAVPLQ